MSSRGPSVTQDVLSIELLGSPAISAGGRRVQVDTRKAVALLAYIAVTRESPRRDTLAALLWPDHDERRARAALRRTLSVLRSGLEDRWLVAERDQISLDRGGVRLDLDELRSGAAGCDVHRGAPQPACDACFAGLSSSAELWRGDFMAGFALRDSATFDDWQFFQAEGVRREVGVLLERLVEALVQRGRTDEAIAQARRWLGLDELNEAAHRRLMSLYAMTGQRSAALRQFRRCVAVLGSELGVAPLEETTELYEAILADRLPAAPPPAPAVHTAPAPVGLPLVGREADRSG
ncbi:MAG TPA: BTAD domain-containing putative transcriptional regulator, partial [Actinomycetota bacterium]|nr:BTAD domain-containing putative transcriptional regulator [Actinomycetota bacterium]